MNSAPIASPIALTCTRHVRHAGMLWMLLALFLQAKIHAQPATAPLTRVADIKALGNERASAGLPVRLDAVVTASKTFLFVVQDDSGAIYVDPTDLKTPVSVGQRVRVEGKTGKGGFAPIVAQPAITILGPGVLPQPQIIPWDHLLTGQMDNQWVEVRGIVKAETNVFDHLKLEVDGIEGRFPVWLLLPATEPASRPLLDAEVQLQGVYQVAFNQAGQLTGFQLQVPGFTQLQIHRPPPVDPFALPVRSISSLLRFDSSGQSGHRVQLQGTVLHQQPGQAIYLQDATGTTRVACAMTESLQPGDQIVVVGFPAPGSHMPELEDAIFRKLGAGPTPRPRPVDLEHPSPRDQQFQLVSIEASLVNLEPSATQQTLILRSGSSILEAVHQGRFPGVGQLRAGSTLTVSGIFLGRRGDGLNPQSLSLLLRSPADVIVRKQSSWWTLQRLLLLAGALGCLALLGAIWAAALSRRVKAQTIELRRQLARETELERQYRTLAESCPVGIWKCGVAEEPLYLNPAMCRLLGVRDVRELNQMTWSDFLKPGPENPFQIHINPMQIDPSTALEAEIEGRDGHRRQLIITTAPLVGSDGTSRGAIHSCVDISIQKQSLTEAAAARDAAIEAARAKSEFLATMSHEIRTPLNGILGMNELLEQTRLDSRQRMFSQTVAESGKALLSIVNDILDFSKVEAGKMQLAREDFDLHPVVDGVLKLVGQTEPEKQVALHSEIESSVPERFRGDAGRLRQVLLNLVGNALKFTSVGSVIVRVRSLGADGDRVRVRFEVADTGTGIPTEKLGLLFQPFQQVDSSAARRHGGTGLGLAISRRLVELMGGHIGVESALGQGSTFWFELPLTVVPAEPRADAIQDAGTGVSQRRVLLVQGQAINRRLSLLTLAKLGCNVDAAKSGHEALGRLQAQPYDAVLFDLRLDDMEGTQFANRVRAWEKSSPSPTRLPLRLIALTTAETSEAPLSPLQVGIDRVLVQPLGMESLKVALSGTESGLPSSEGLTGTRT